MIVPDTAKAIKSAVVVATFNAGFENAENVAKALIAALDREGIALVPKDPTPEQYQAYKDCLRIYIESLPPEERLLSKGRKRGFFVKGPIRARHRYQAMVGASPFKP